MAPSKTKFTEGERVLCFHGPLLYEAKCVKHQIKEKSVRYFIHYNGWNKNWDEWVPEGRVLKLTDANLQKQKELFAAHKARAKKAKLQKKPPAEKEKERASTPTVEKQQSKRTAKTDAPASSNQAQSSEATSSDTSRKKRATRQDPTVETEENFLDKVEVKVRIPEELKPILVDDWDLITRQKMLLHLPAKHSVDSIIEDYIKFKKAKSASKESSIIEVTQGLKEYFNIMLGTQLLYKFERSQYADILSAHQEDPMSKVYGGQHFLRLFVKLGEMLAYTTLDEKNMSLLLTHIHDILKFMLKNSSVYFNNNNYEVATPEYHRKSM